MRIRCKSFRAAMKKAYLYAEYGAYAIVGGDMKSWYVDVDLDR